MPPVISTTNADSESEDDEYIPPVDEQVTDSESSDTEKSLLEGTSHTATVEDLEEKKRKRDALWAEFQTSVTNATRPPIPSHNDNTVKIEKRYRFAGHEVIEVVQVPEDSSEAKKWPLWKEVPKAVGEVDAPSPPAARTEAISDSTTTTATTTTTTTTTPRETLSLTTERRQQQQQQQQQPHPGTNSAGGTAPRRRKPKKTILGPLPNIGAATKPKKLTTLDKSAMDWRAHIQAEQDSSVGGGGSSLKDELEANRRAGGYLGKMEFLKRVEERKEENLNVMKSSKRRRL